MPFQKGDKRPPNAGRKAGSRNKRSLEITRAVASTGKTPLEVMLEGMRHYLAIGNLDKACAFAKDAAPYIHPRLAAIQHTGTDGGPIETQDVSLPELARKIALILSLAAREKAGLLENAGNGGK